MLVEKPRWKHGNIGFIDPAEPLMIRNGRQHYLIHWDNPCYEDENVDCSYAHKMENVSKSKCEVWISPEQCVALKGLWKSRALGRRLLEESSSLQQRIVEEDDTLELSIDPFAEVSPQERLQAAQKRLLQVGEEDVQASKPLQEGRKKSPALQEKSKQSSQRRQLIMEDDEPLQEGRKKSPALQEKSKQSSQRRQLIMEDDDEM